MKTMNFLFAFLFLSSAYSYTATVNCVDGEYVCQGGDCGWGISMETATTTKLELKQVTETIWTATLSSKIRGMDAELFVSALIPLDGLTPAGLVNTRATLTDGVYMSEGYAGADQFTGYTVTVALRKGLSGVIYHCTNLTLE